MGVILMCSSQWGQEEENAMLGSFYLDPFTTYLDEMQFRVDSFEVDDGYVIEAERKQTAEKDIFIEINQESCSISLQHPEGMKERTILFPFSLENLSIRIELANELIQIYVSRQANTLQKGPFSLWIPINEAK